MSGWVPHEADWWEPIRATLQRPLCREAALFDLRWRVDQGESIKRSELRKCWGWTDGKVRGLLRRSAAWWDPKKGDAPTLAAPRPADKSKRVRTRTAPDLHQAGPGLHQDCTSADQDCTRDEQANLAFDATCTTPDQGCTTPDQTGPGLHHAGPDNDHTRIETTPSPSPSPPPSPHKGVSTPWLTAELKKRKHVKQLGTKPEVLDAIRVTLNRWRGDDLDATPARTVGKPILALYDAMAESYADRVTLPKLAEAAGLIGDACKRCPDPIFARDVRAEGWDGGTNRCSMAGAVFRVAPKADSMGADWEQRLKVATRWQAAGKPTQSWTAENGTQLDRGQCREDDHDDVQATDADEQALLRLAGGV